MLKRIRAFFGKSAEEKAEDPKPERPVDVNTPVTNPDLVAAMQRLKADTSDESRDALIVELNRAHFLAAVFDDEMEMRPTGGSSAVIEQGSRIKMLSVADAQGHSYLPLFTDWDALRSYIEAPVSSLVMPSQDAWHWALEMGDYTGVVVNPANDSLPLNRDMLMVLAGEAQPPVATRPASRDEIYESLARLMTRKNDDAFTVFEDVKAEKFVQFAGGVGESLRFDLPAQALSAGELEKAHLVLSDFGIEFEEYDVYDQPHGDVVGTQGGFSADLGQDAAKGADIAWRVFMEVFGLSEGFKMAIHEN